MCLLNIMRDVMDFGVLRFSVVVLKEDNYLCLFCPVDQSLDALNRSITALRNIPEMITAMPNEPTTSEPLCQF